MNPEHPRFVFREHLTGLDLEKVAEFLWNCIDPSDTVPDEMADYLLEPGELEGSRLNVQFRGSPMRAVVADMLEDFQANREVLAVPSKRMTLVEIQVPEAGEVTHDVKGIAASAGFL